jgi:hypothetical protein
MIAVNDNLLRKQTGSNKVNHGNLKIAVNVNLHRKWTGNSKVSHGNLKIAVNVNLHRKRTGNSKVNHVNLRTAGVVETISSNVGVMITMVETGAEEDKYISL